MSILDLDAIERLARTASPGPWRLTEPSIDCGHGRRSDGIVDAAGEPVIVFDPSESEYAAGVGREADQNYLAGFGPDVILALIARVRAAEERAGEAERQRDDAMLLLKESRCSYVSRLQESEAGAARLREALDYEAARADVSVAECCRDDQRFCEQYGCGDMRAIATRLRAALSTTAGREYAEYVRGLEEALKQWPNCPAYYGKEQVGAPCRCTRCAALSRKPGAGGTP